MGIPVELMHIEVIDVPTAENLQSFRTWMELMDSLALAVLCHPSTMRGEEVRFLRKYVNKSAREFAQYLHIEHTGLSKIENSQRKLTATMDKLIRLTVFGMQPKLKR